MPENVKLNYFQYKKDQAVTIKAQAPSAEVKLCSSAFREHNRPETEAARTDRENT